MIHTCCIGCGGWTSQPTVTIGWLAVAATIARRAHRCAVSIKREDTTDPAQDGVEQKNVWVHTSKALYFNNCP